MQRSANDGWHQATLHATYFASSDAHPATKQANTIIPISTLSDTSANDASVPPKFTVCITRFVVFLMIYHLTTKQTNVTLPRNAVQVYAELYASGNGNEEFWVIQSGRRISSFLSDVVQLVLQRGQQIPRRPPLGNHLWRWALPRSQTSC